MRVAVIGSSGGMGKFFVRYFLSRGFEVTGADTGGPAFEGQRFKFESSNAAAARDADVVLIATPVGSTTETASGVIGAMKPGSTLLEISSVKGKILPELRKLLATRKGDIRLLSTHPLFGPSLSEWKGMRVCVVETEKRGRNSALRLARELFPDAVLVPMSEREHDEKMGLVLSATHLLSIAYASMVSRYLSPEEFRKVQTPTSGVQLTLAEGILSQDPSLYSYIQMQNEHSGEYAAALIDELTQMLRYIEEKDALGFETRFRELSRRYSGDSRDALDLVYQAFEKSPT